MKEVLLVVMDKLIKETIDDAAANTPFSPKDLGLIHIFLIKSN
jgi:hypothetical protein